MNPTPRTTTVAAENNKPYNNRSLLTCLCVLTIVAGFAAQPLHAVVSSRYAYVADIGANQIDEYSITPLTGALVHLPNCPVIASGAGPTSVVVDPTGRFVYVANQGANSIFLYNINPLNGCLAASAGNPFPTIFGAFSLGISCNGKFLYASETAGNQVEGFTINPANGFLAPVAGSPFLAGLNPMGIAVDAAGYVYVANSGPGTITAFAITPGGTLGLIGAFPAGGANPLYLAVDTVGQFLYATLQGVNMLSSMPIIAGFGGLGGPNLIATGAAPFGVTVSALGQTAYVADNAIGKASSYLINPATGVLAANGALKATGAFPTGITADYYGRFLYVTDNGANTVHQYTINANTGALAPIAGPPVPTANGPFAIATTP